MNNKPINRRKIFTILELGFLGLLGWVALSGTLFYQSSLAEAQKDQLPDGRWIPPEGPTPKFSALAPTNGTLTCTTFDFAGGATQGFTTEVTFGTPTNLWHVTNGACRASLAGHTTPFTFYYGNDNTCNYDTGARNAANLISPPISLVGVFAPFTVSFNYLLFVEGGGFDTTFVDISTNNGASWTQILSKNNLINDNQWHNASTNITANVGAATSIRFRFRFDSVDNIANATTGWHVDDISVCGAAFNQCVQDDVTGDFIEFNTVTGAYITQQCHPPFSNTPFTFSGTGTITTSGSFVTLTDFGGLKFNSVTVNTANHTGSGIIRVVNGFSIIIYQINDSNTLNNTCACT
ncbi:MAG TPA: hypothetical protein VKN18_17670 [Blastocatellia bacterium]|nr:hypothetical protein [Blastocatellia bacterium]